MPPTIDTAFVNQYQNTMRILCQQAESRLEGTTVPPVKQEGEYLYWERLGPSEAVEVASRNADTPNIDTEFSRRRSAAQQFIWSTLLDRADAERMLVDPKGPYQQIAKNAMNRRKDRIILAALGGTAWAGKNGTVAVPLPSSRKIAHSSTGLTIGKLLAANRMLKEAEAPPPYYLVCPQKNITDLLNTTEITSADYNTVRALVNGEIDTFLGFKFIQTELVYLENGSSTTTWYCYAYAQGAVGMGMLSDIEVELSEIPTKNYAWQPWIRMHLGATRVEDEMVVEIASQ